MISLQQNKPCEIQIKPNKKPNQFKTYIKRAIFLLIMAKDNKISLPSSGAGITRYFESEKSKVMISPQAAVFTILAVVVLILVLTGF